MILDKQKSGEVSCLIDFNVPKALGRNSRVLSSQRLCLARVCPQPLQHSSSPAAVRLGTQMVCSSSRMLVQIFQMVLPTCPTYIGPLSATSSPFHLHTWERGITELPMLSCDLRTKTNQSGMTCRVSGPLAWGWHRLLLRASWCGITQYHHPQSIWGIYRLPRTGTGHRLARCVPSECM